MEKSFYCSAREYETVTVKVPKPIMDFLRAHEKDMDKSAEKYIEREIVNFVQADLESMLVFVPSPKELAENWNLNAVFKTVLNYEIK